MGIDGRAGGRRAVVVCLVCLAICGWGGVLVGQKSRRAVSDGELVDFWVWLLFGPSEV